MKTSEVIKIRRSCRTYNGLKIDHSSISQLMTSVEGVMPLFDDVEQPIIKFIDNEDINGRLGTYGFINGARRFLVMAAGKSVAQQVQAGYAFEQVILKATEMGIGTCWLGGTFRHSVFASTMPSDMGDREILIVSPLGHVTSKQRFAERMMRKVVKADRRKPFSTLFPNIDQNSSIGRIMEAVRLAPSSSNSQPWRAVLRDGNVEFSCTTDNRFSAIDMGIAYCHFMLLSAEEGLRWRIDPASLINPLALRFIPC